MGVGVWVGCRGVGEGVGGGFGNVGERGVIREMGEGWGRGEKESVCQRLCERETERLCVCERETERQRERETTTAITS